MNKICIDGYNIALPRGTGIATYGRGLLEANRARGADCEILFGPAAPRSPDNIVNEAALIEPPRPAQRLKRAQKVKRATQTFSSQFGRMSWPIDASFEVLWPHGATPPAARFWAAQDLYHRANRCFRSHGRFTPLTFERSAPTPSVMHWTAPLPLWARDIPNIYTIHDLIPLKAPHTTLHDRAEFMAMHREAIRRADQIAVVSETTRHDVMKIFDIKEERITTTYQALSLPENALEASDNDIATDLESTFNLEWKNYFIHFGSIEPKKNLGRIVEAYLSTGLKTPLVVIGSRGWLDADETALLNQVKRIGGQSADRIRIYEYMSRPMLINLIRGAKATLFPSLYEGFGLPILESLALGSPVLTSAGGATGEVAGDAAVLVDPFDVSSIATGIRMLGGDEGLGKALTVKGRERARLFSRSAYESRLEELYARVA